MKDLSSHLASFLKRCDGTAARLGIARATLSNHLFADGKRLANLAAGGTDIGIGRLVRAEATLSEIEARGFTHKHRRPSLALKNPRADEPVTEAAPAKAEPAA